MEPPCVFALVALLQQVLQPHTFHRAMEAFLFNIPCLQLLIPACLTLPPLHATVPAAQQLHLVKANVRTNEGTWPVLNKLTDKFAFNCIVSIKNLKF